MASVRIIQRTPDLGLALRMQPACQPQQANPGAARWWNPVTRECDAETLHARIDINTAYVQNGVFLLNGIPGAPISARVTGDLAACSVEWAWSYSGDAGIVSQCAIVDRALAVGVQFAGLVGDNNQFHGVLTATATVICGEKRQQMAPIQLLITVEEWGV